ncbi:MAG: aryl-sulfate sulfotransferase [Saprospiraceae bacterium]|nr:aryl-sulfate sulfotransferase [Saprospiraceae bacterium]
MNRHLNKIALIFTVTLALGHSLLGQDENTIGLLSIDPNSVSEGYILLNPENQSTVYLINNCGEIVHSWDTDEVRFPGKEQYLDRDGRLYLASIQPDLQEPSFGAGGAGGVLEILDWEGNIEWQHVVADIGQRQHHDIHIMPNGNIMFIAWENMTIEDAAQMGFDTLNNPQIGFWPDKIVEIDPKTDDIVWQWRSIDHMIQDIDSSIVNFGDIASHPERININYIDFAFGRQDVHHINSLDYNEELDMVMVSVRNFNEIWIIDHSTTIEESASNSGGLRGKGGDLLYRWGNPSAYDAGDANDQQLYRQHDAAWIDDVPFDHPYYGQVSVYNNFIGPELSLGAIFKPEFNQEINGFEIDDNVYLPDQLTTTISHPDQVKNFSTAASNIQLLPNGNVIMCAGRQGRMFEITDSGELAWEYLVPMRNGFPIHQGDEIQLSENFTFSGRRYDPSFEGFQNKDLTPKGYIEMDANEEFCELPVSIIKIEEIKNRIFPNPVTLYITIEATQRSVLRILNASGRVCRKSKISAGTNTIALDGLENGLYIFQIQGDNQTYKILIL